MLIDANKQVSASRNSSDPYRGPTGKGLAEYQALKPA
jgi:hypothetical protein